MYIIVLKNCMLNNSVEYFTEEKDCYVQQICNLGEKSNVTEVIEYFMSKKIFDINSEEKIRVINEEVNKFEREAPCVAVFVNRKYDYEFVENTILVLSFFQKYPAELFAIIGYEDNKFGLEFYPNHYFPHYKSILPERFEDFYKKFNSSISKYKYLLKLYFEINKESEVGYKIAKYYSLLEVISKRKNSQYELEKIKILLTEYELNQLLEEGKYCADLSVYVGKLSNYLLNKRDLSYIELMSAYRHLVVHHGILNPNEIKNCFEDNQDMLFLLNSAVEMILKDIIFNNKEF